MTWSFGILHPTQEITRALNHLQVQMVTSMMKKRRVPGEGYVEHQQRVQRLARAAIHASGRDRWGTVHIRLTWRYLGHRLRSAASTNPSCAGVATQFRDLNWWEQEQLRPSGHRHGRRHFPRLMNQQREVREVAGEQWASRALNRADWAMLESSWVRFKDIP